MTRVCRTVRIFFFGIVLGLAAVQLYRAYGPWAAGAHTFKSDAAIPILMANAKRVGLYHLYYFGQDRIGAWPFLLMQLGKAVVGRSWEPETFFLVQLGWLLLGGVVLAALVPGFEIAALLIFLLTILHNPGTLDALELCNPYSWQITCLLLSWLALRRQRFLLALFFSYLAIWTSQISAPLLVIIAFVEAARRRSATENSSRFLAGFGLCLLPILGAAGIEKLVHDFVFRLSPYYSTYVLRTSMLLNLKELPRLLGIMWSGYRRASPWWPTVFISLSGGVYLSVRAFRKIAPTWLVDISCVVVAGSACALVNYLLFTVSNHWRLNDYSQRYLTISQFFWEVSALFFLCLVLRSALKSQKSWRIGAGALVCLTVLGLIAFRKSAAPKISYQKTRDAAKALETAAPGAVLLGGYWGTYVYIAFQKDHPLRPVVAEGEFQRMPWLIDDLKQATTVIVSNREFPKYGTADNPLPSIEAYGKNWVVDQEKWPKVWKTELLLGFVPYEPVE